MKENLDGINLYQFDTTTSTDEGVFHGSRCFGLFVWLHKLHQVSHASKHLL